MGLSQAAIDALARKGAERGVDLRPGMALVEERLRDRVTSELPFVEEASRYLMDAGGKRFRPMLVLLSGMLGGADPTQSELADAGVVVELVHLSTLYHDDVIDAADVRRGASAAHVKWSNTVAILTGDFLLARASELSAALGVEVTRVMARTIADLCRGQIREVQGSTAAPGHGAPRLPQTREHYLTVIGEKTASLIASSCRLGGLLSGQPPEEIETLASFGWHLGMSFQLADDVLDIAAQSTESGKVPGTDLREGVRTLPVLLALEQDGEGGPLGRLLEDGSEAAVVEALALLRDHPTLDLARAAARLESEKAKQALGRLPGQPAVLGGLAHLADHAVDRLA